VFSVYRTDHQIDNNLSENLTAPLFVDAIVKIDENCVLPNFLAPGARFSTTTAMKCVL
jgi:hypothetical protein